VADKKKQGNYIYDAFLKGDDFMNRNSMYTNAKRAVRFYEGEQWYDENQKDWRKLPYYNFIRPIVDYKTAMVAKNTMVLNYSPLNYSGEPAAQAAYREYCSDLNKYVADKWEELQMDTAMWTMVKKAAITGDSYFYFGTSDMLPQILDSTNVYLADEQEPEIQKQAYIIIRERRSVDDVRKDAASGVDKSLIVADEPKDQINNDSNEVKSEDGKVTSYLYLSRSDNGYVTFARATSTVVYQPEVEVTGMDRYPVAAFVWNRRYNSARGLGEVNPLIPNQIAANKLLLRREVNNKQTGYPKPVYHKDYITNPEALERIGAKVEITGGNQVQDVAKAFTYIQPAPMSADGERLQNEIIQTTRNLANASDEATGNVDPEKASGKAISLVIDQNAVMLTEQNAQYKQLCENIGLIWFNIFQVYNPNGMALSWYDDNGDRQEVELGGEELSQLKVRVRIDVSSNNPWSVYANDQEAMNLFGNGYIDFAQYVELLSDQNHMKPKLQEFVKEAEEQQMLQQEQQMMAPPEQELPPGVDINQLLGGMPPM
jgi:hypothetical protein